MKVLYLTQWYPNRYDAMAGLFVRNHAAAAARAGVDVCVLYFQKTNALPMGAQIEVTDQVVNGVRELVVYYRGRTWYAMDRGLEMLRERWGMPDLCQVNVLSKNALMAYNLWRKHRIPYVVVEHWSGYLDANGDYKENVSALKRLIYRRIARDAKAMLVVSNLLKQSMRQYGIENARTMVVRNVVDDVFYEPGKMGRPQGVYELLHVSCFDEKAKNVRGILEAAWTLRKRRQDFRLTLVGTGQDFEAVKAYADELGLTDSGVVRFLGELAPGSVHEVMCSAHALVIFSRYETAGVVFAEALASGLPIVTTPVGIAPEVVTEKTGRLVEQGDVRGLASAMEHVMTHASDYDATTLRKAAEPFRAEVVGNELRDLYASVLS